MKVKKDDYALEIIGLNFGVDVKNSLIEKYIGFFRDDGSPIFKEDSEVTIDYLYAFLDEADDANNISPDFDLISICKIVANNDENLTIFLYQKALLLLQVYKIIYWSMDSALTPKEHSSGYYLEDEVKRIDELIQLLEIKNDLNNANLTIEYSEKNYKPKKIINYPFLENPDMFSKMAYSLYTDWAIHFRLDHLEEKRESWWDDLYSQSTTFNTSLYLIMKKGWKCSFTIESLTILKNEITKRNNTKRHPTDIFFSRVSVIIYEFLSDTTSNLLVKEKDKHRFIYSLLITSGGLYGYKDFDHGKDFDNQKEDYIKHL